MTFLLANTLVYIYIYILYTGGRILHRVALRPPGPLLVHQHVEGKWPRRGHQFLRLSGQHELRGVPVSSSQNESPHTLETAGITHHD